MRFLRYSLSGLFLMALTLAFLAYAGSLLRGAVEERMSKEPRPSRSNERVFTVRVQQAEAQEVTPVLTAFGQIESARRLDLRAATSGTVVTLSDSFVEGGTVTAGEVLLVVDPAEAESALARAASDLADAKREAREAVRAIELAQGDLEAAKDQAALRSKALERQNDLAARGVGTAAAVETAELAAASARQAVLARQQSLAQAEARSDQALTKIERAELARADAARRLDNTVLRAEFDGALSGVSVARGGLVAGNERIAQLIDPGALEVSFRISTAHYARLLSAEGDLIDAPVTAVQEVFGTNLTATGRISRDSAAVGEGQSGRLLFAKLDPAPGFKPGDFVRVDVAEPALQNVIRLPSSALGADASVLVLGSENRLERAGVTLLLRQGDEVLIRAPALAGREVVTARTPLLGAGIKVKPLRDTGGDVPKAPEMVSLSPERRAKIRAYVEANGRIPKEAKARILSQLEKDQVPARMVKRLETRMGG